MASPLPPFWEEREVDGRPFYVDHSTGTTTWVRPTANGSGSKGKSNGKSNDKSNGNGNGPRQTMKRQPKRKETNLVQVNVSDALDSTWLMGSVTQQGGTPIVIIPTSRPFLKLKVPMGCHAIVTRRGASVGIYRPGSYLRPWFYRVAYLVTTQHLPYHFSVNACPTKDNVLITLECDFLLHISDPEKFVFSIGPENMEELLRASQAETVRTLVRTLMVREVYDLRGYESEEMVQNLNKVMLNYGVTVTQVTIAGVQLPDELVMSMQNETTYETKQIEQQKQQEFDVVFHRDTNELKRLELDRKNEGRRVEEEARKERLLIEHEIQELRARMERVLAEIETDEMSEVGKLDATRELDVGKLRNEVKKQKSIIEASAQGEVGKIRAEQMKKKNELLGESTIAVTENLMRARTMIAAAEKDSSKSLVKKRQFLETKERIRVLGELAKNNDLAITGEAADNIAQMMCVRESAKVLRLN